MQPKLIPRNGCIKFKPAEVVMKDFQESSFRDKNTLRKMNNREYFFTTKSHAKHNLCLANYKRVIGN